MKLAGAAHSRIRSRVRAGDGASAVSDFSGNMSWGAGRRPGTCFLGQSVGCGVFCGRTPASTTSILSLLNGGAVFVQRWDTMVE